MTSVQSSLDADPDEVDLSGLVESIVDSDEEEDLAESMDVSATAGCSLKTRYTCTWSLHSDVL